MFFLLSPMLSLQQNCRAREQNRFGPSSGGGGGWVGTMYSHKLMQNDKIKH
jgi:hypothetical protein